PLPRTAGRLPGMPGQADPGGEHVAYLRGRGVEGDRVPAGGERVGGGCPRRARPGGQGHRHDGGPEALPAEERSGVNDEAGRTSEGPRPTKGTSVARPHEPAYAGAGATFSKLP